MDSTLAEDFRQLVFLKLEVAEHLCSLPYLKLKLVPHEKKEKDLKLKVLSKVLSVRVPIARLVLAECPKLCTA